MIGFSRKTKDLNIYEIQGDSLCKMRLSGIKKVSALWLPAKVNPENGKATTIPVLNPYDVYGRCFTLSWLGFMVAFLSWFAFPPLMSDIKKDMNLTATEVSNSNIVGLCSTLLARFVLGPLCDRFGPRIVMALTLLIGAVPTAFVPLVNNASGIYAIRFFIGFLGGTFVPCQFWTAVFFDKSIVGRASSLTGGWGNAGGGIAFFVMPAVTRALQNDGYTLNKSWKYAFEVCPFIIIMFVAAITLLFGRDCPEGKWSERTRMIEMLDGQDAEVKEFVKRKPGYDIEEAPSSPEADKKIPESNEEKGIHFVRSTEESLKPTQTFASRMQPVSTAMSRLSQVGAPHLDPITDPHSTIEDPTFLSFLKTSFSPYTMLNALPYATTFGGELAVESIVSALYAAQSKHLGDPWSTSLSGNWGAMMGLLNVVFRPLGGWVSDVLYARFKTLQVKKYWTLTCGFLMGVFLLYVGLYKSISMPGIVVSLAFMSLFMEMGNGANFSLVPHTNPHHTGVVSGTTGAFGNLGGVLFSLAFRFSTFPSGDTDYMSALWYLGVTIMGINALCVFLPLPRDDQY